MRNLSAFTIFDIRFLFLFIIFVSIIVIIVIAVIFIFICIIRSYITLHQLTIQHYSTRDESDVGGGKPVVPSGLVQVSSDVSGLNYLMGANSLGAVGWGSGIGHGDVYAVKIKNGLGKIGFSS